ncbi:MAG: AraC family transcriptional regulator [Bacteroidota bacterium]
MSIETKSINDFVRVLHLAKEGQKEKYTGNFHSHHYFEIVLIHSATGISHMIDFDDFTCQPGDAFLLHSNQIHKFSAQPDATHKMTVLQIESKYFLEVVTGANEYSDMLTKAFYLTNRLKIDEESRDRILNIIRQITLEIESKEEHYTFMISNLLRILLIEISRKAEIDSGVNAEKDILKRFWLLLDTMYHQSVTIDDISDKLNISPRQLHRIIVGTTGLSPKKHKDERLSLQAKRLLYSSGRAVKEFSYELGFNDVSNFTKFFIRKNGLTPIEFRRKMSEKYH